MGGFGTATSNNGYTELFVERPAADVVVPTVGDA